jgi:hypothetical protein
MQNVNKKLGRTGSLGAPHTSKQKSCSVAVYLNEACSGVHRDAVVLVSLKNAGTTQKRFTFWCDGFNTNASP